MLNEVKAQAPRTQQTSELPTNLEPVARPGQPGHSVQDSLVRSPAAMSMSYAAPAPQQSFERNALKAPSCPGLCWPADEDCCSLNSRGGRLCCIKIG